MTWRRLRERADSMRRPRPSSHPSRGSGHSPHRRRPAPGLRRTAAPRRDGGAPGRAAGSSSTTPRCARTSPASPGGRARRSAAARGQPPPRRRVGRSRQAADRHGSGCGLSPPRSTRAGSPSRSRTARRSPPPRPRGSRAARLARRSRRARVRISWVMTPRRRWVGRTPTRVTPAAGSSPPGTVRAEREVGGRPTIASPSYAANSRSGSRTFSSRSASRHSSPPRRSCPRSRGSVSPPREAVCGCRSPSRSSLSTASFGQLSPGFENHVFRCTLNLS